MKESTTRRGQNFPLDNLTYDLISMLNNKSQALEAYDKYMKDAQGNPEIGDLLEEMRSSDEEFVRQLQQHLGQVLQTGTEKKQAAAGSGGSSRTGATSGIAKAARGKSR